MADMKNMAKPFGTLFALALIVAVLGRIGLTFAGVTGVLAFDYISASGVALLDVICSILTGSAFVAFLFAAGLALVLSTAAVALYGALYARGASRAKPSSAFLWGWATAFVALVCLVVVVLGILSAVQVGSMSSKLPGIPVLILTMIVFAAFLGTLLGAASLVVCACVAKARKDGHLGRRLMLACALCGFAVTVLTVGTFSALNTTSLSLPTLGIWCAVDIVANLVMLLVARNMLIKAEADKSPQVGSAKMVSSSQSAVGSVV